MPNFLTLLKARGVRCFLAGVFAVLPLVITVAVVIWVADFVQHYIGPDTMLGQQLSRLGLKVAQDSPGFVSYLLGWLIVLAAVFAVGVAIEFGARQLLERLVGGLLDRVPLIGSIYRTSKQVVGMLDKKDEADLQGMTPVFCLFGKDNPSGVLALLVSSQRYHIDGRDYQIVVIPTAPVPFGGALMFVPVDQIRVADIPVDGLMSIYVSMGATAGDFLTESQE